uniref:SET domain-containing protein n=1 Tax=Pseudo-nitzschia australis TaxID=44445 RepID=A0A7S4AA84_9STRA|mmetsp:Transcript_7687/g.16549  ORF Transcript_7687/g.16549 Transcript_7687/m.16549 type:complete len:588 (+) Transcript_7687:78-1841(+)
MIVTRCQGSLCLAITVWILSCAQTICTSSTSKEEVESNDEPSCNASGVSVDGELSYCIDREKSRVPDGCQLVFAKVPANAAGDKNGEGDQWATYTMVPRKKGTPVRRDGDIVIQWTDPSLEISSDLLENHYYRKLRRMTWNGQETGGQYEGERVESVATGIGMTARSTTTKRSSRNTVLPLVPRVDDGSLTRFDSPGAGAITRYHNYTWWFLKDLQAGDELVYSAEGKITSSLLSQATVTTTHYKNENNDERERPSLEYLNTNGYCMDNMRPRKSRIEGAGRGAFATRDLPFGSVVAPVPVALIHRDELRKVNRNDQQQEYQLLLNYCLGHTSSSWLLFPYTPVVNLINHYNKPNVELRWSTTNRQSHGEINTNQTMFFELVASRSIKIGEEIYLDYGRDWEDSWWKHVRETWKPNNQHYTPSYVMDDTVKMIRTEQEQKDHPYPNDLLTTCFYRYSDRSEEERIAAENNENKDSLTSFRWRLTKGLYDLKNLRPCRVLKRTEDKSGRSAYAIHMLNRAGLDDDEIIPRGEIHIVTHIPRAAIRFSDRAGTTDQHLRNAFRHEIGVPEDLIPAGWKVSNTPNPSIKE